MLSSSHNYCYSPVSVAPTLTRVALALASAHLTFHQPVCFFSQPIDPAMTVSSPATSTDALDELAAKLADGANAYDPTLYLARARAYLAQAYPDLAAGDAYRAVLLTDYIRDYSDEGDLLLDDSGVGNSGREEEGEDEEDGEEEGRRTDAEEFYAATQAVLHLRRAAGQGDAEPLLEQLEQDSLLLLVTALKEVGCDKQAGEYARLGVQRFPKARGFREVLGAAEAADKGNGGRARRLVYPWNSHEPDRFSAEAVGHLNGLIVPRSSDCVEVRVVNLPLLSEAAEVLGETKHLGVFAKRDIVAGENCMREESALTVVTDPAEGGLCEYCGCRWRKEAVPSRPKLVLRLPGDAVAEGGKERKADDGEDDAAPAETFACDLCAEAEAEGIEAVVPIWCSPHCRDMAMAKYHPALCSRPIAPIHRAALRQSDAQVARSSQPGGAVYALLMMKAFAMALTQGVHPLELEETKYLYGVPPVEVLELRIGWGWEENVRGVVGILEALGIDVFSGKHPSLSTEVSRPDWWDTWVVNTLIAKFRGTASGRLNAHGETEAAAAHTLYSLVNHDCEPNVRWECAGIMRFWGVGGEGSGIAVKEGHELQSCYCDNSLPYKERREWMMGCLGGACMCSRCLREEKEDKEREKR